MLKFIVLFVSLFLGDAFSRDLPTEPVGCFVGKNSCSTVNIVRYDGEKMIDVRVFAKIAKSNYPTVEDVIDPFLDFAQWPNYVAGSDNIEFNLSEELEFLTHKFDYVIKAPFPVMRVNVVGVARFLDKTSSYDESVRSYTFSLDKSHEYSGLKKYFGEVHIYNETRNSFNVSFKAIVDPTISIGLELAKPYIQRPLKEILDGMYK